MSRDASSPDPRALEALRATVRLAQGKADEGRPCLIGLAGAQGSGKSTLAASFARTSGMAAVHVSLDDFYLSAAARTALARDVHPLLRTRGPPGTHDLPALEATLEALQAANPRDRTMLRAFDKVADDVLPRQAWTPYVGRPDLIVLEGWCVGATAQPAEALREPVNALERDEDADGAWRRFANAQLAGGYRALFECLDAVAFLRAPDFDVVLDWRCEQQASLLHRPLTPDDRSSVGRFIQHFERISRHMLAGGIRADVVAQLDLRRRVEAIVTAAG